MSEKSNSEQIRHIPYLRDTYAEEEMLLRAKEYHQWAEKRRTVRQISNRHVSISVINEIILTASSAPSGAHKQPWHFALIGDATIKSEIRKAAEKEEYENYHGRMSDRWLEDLKVFGTNWEKPFLEIAPWLIVVFKKVYDLDQLGQKNNNYYVNESVGIACGFLLMAIHHAGLVTLTHTPSPMNFLSTILKRPDNERPFLLLPVGYPDENALVPDIKRKSLSEICSIY